MSGSVTSVSGGGSAAARAGLGAASDADATAAVKWRRESGTEGLLSALQEAAASASSSTAMVCAELRGG